MPYLKVLRNLVDQQQFAGLKTGVKGFLAETGDVRALPLMAMARAHLGERGKALADIAEAEAELEALDLDARVDLAGAYCLVSRVDNAAGLLEKALADRPDHSLALARMAWCKMQAGESDDARDLYGRSARLAPDRLPVWSALAGLCLSAGDIPGAQYALDRGIGRLEAAYGKLPDAVAVGDTVVVTTELAGTPSCAGATVGSISCQVSSKLTMLMTFIFLCRPMDQAGPMEQQSSPHIRHPFA
jgi:Tfp pilus assembly protein PilF